MITWNAAGWLESKHMNNSAMTAIMIMIMSALSYTHSRHDYKRLHKGDINPTAQFSQYSTLGNTNAGGIVIFRSFSDLNSDFQLYISEFTH